jgi:hypothetical protein
MMSGQWVGNEWAISGQYLSMHLEFKIKIVLKCKWKKYSRYDISISLKCKSKHIFWRIFKSIYINPQVTVHLPGMVVLN